MKKVVIVLSIIATFLVVVGGGLFGLYLGTNLNEINKDVIENIYTFNTSELYNFKLDLEVSEINFKKSSDEEIKIECKEFEDYKYEVFIKDNTLHIENIDERDWVSRSFLGIMYSNLRVTIYLPELDYGNLDINSATSNLNIESGFNFENVNIKLSTGDINFNSTIEDNIKLETTTGQINATNIKANNMVVKTTTGDIKLVNVDVVEEINVKSTTGKQFYTIIKTNKLISTSSTGKIIYYDVNVNNFEAKSTTGDLDLHNFIATGVIRINNTTGNITFDKCDGESLYIHTTTGSVTGTLLTDKSFFVKTITGKLEYPKTRGGDCEIETTTGDIILEIFE